MKRPLITIACLIAFALASVSLAEYDPKKDSRIRLNNRQAESIASTAEVGTVGDELYTVQEETHDTVTDTTGVEVEHSYLWVCVGDECVPVDPLRFSN